jgi:predicted Zn-dependent protease
MDPYGRRPAGGRRFGGGRLLIAALVALVSIIGYYGTRVYNPITEEVQHVDISPDQEIALGLQAAPEMAEQYGGLHLDAQAQALVDRVGGRVAGRSAAHDSPYRYEFHVLADEDTINAFALPGGQVFVTAGLLKHLETEGQLAGVLGHEIGHVVARHGAEHLAKARLTQGLTGAAVLATYDPDDPSSRSSAAVAALIGSLVNMRFGRQDELESDTLGVRLMSEAGYDPRAMAQVMRILEQSATGPRPPEFFSTHPNPDRRVERIEAAIAQKYPRGVPAGLEG